ncbi:MAG: VanZ family protein [Bacteroidota bacterium]
MRRVLPAIVLSLAVLALCSIPGTSLPQVRLLTADKLAHLVMFAALGWAWLRAFPDKVAWVLTGGAAFAVFTEVWQHTLPIGRTGDPADAIADILGLAIAVVVWKIERRYRGPQTSASA